MQFSASFSSFTSFLFLPLTAYKRFLNKLLRAGFEPGASKVRSNNFVKCATILLTLWEPSLGPFDHDLGSQCYQFMVKNWQYSQINSLWMQNVLCNRPLQLPDFLTLCIALA